MARRSFFPPIIYARVLVPVHPHSDLNMPVMKSVANIFALRGTAQR
jgi:hypothetical protein